MGIGWDSLGHVMLLLYLGKSMIFRDSFENVMDRGVCIGTGLDRPGQSNWSNREKLVHNWESTLH